MEGGRLDHLEGQAERRGARRAAVHRRAEEGQGEYTFNVRQTYSDGSVVEWSGDEDSDTPAAHIAAPARDELVERRLGLEQDDRDHRARRRRARAARRRRRARRGEAFGMRLGGRAGALLVVFDGCAGAAGGGVGTRLAARDATAGERRARPTADPGPPHLQRAHRAALRRHLGHGRAGQPGDGGQPGDRARRRELDLHQVQHAQAGLVPRVVARDLGRRAPGARVRSRSPSGRVLGRRRSS